MTKRLALTPAVGLFAGLSVVSYGAVSMLLTGVHGTRTPNPCASVTPTPTTTPTKALADVRSGARAQHPAGIPVLLADAVRLTRSAANGGTAAGAHPAGQTTVSPGGGQSTVPLPSSSPDPSATAPLPQPSPGTSASPGPTLPQPGPAHSTKTGPLNPGGTAQSPTATATATPTTTPTPTSTPTTSPPPSATLCLTIQTLNGVTAVDPGTTVDYAVWVWLTSGTGGTAKIALTATPSSLKPTFSVCVPTGQSTCTVSGLNGGQPVEVEAALTAPSRTGNTSFTLTATATSAQAVNTATASASVNLKPKNPPPTPTPAPGNPGAGGTLPRVGLPGGTTVPPGVGNPPTGDLGSAFPQVSPSPSAGKAAAARHGRAGRLLDVSASLPLDVRLIGGQIIGLAILAAAVTIAVARLSLRRQPAKQSDDSSTSAT